MCVEIIFIKRNLQHTSELYRKEKEDLNNETDTHRLSRAVDHRKITHSQTHAWRWQGRI